MSKKKNKRAKKRRKKKDKKKELSKKIKKGARETIGPIPPSKTFKDKTKYHRKKEKHVSLDDE